MSEQQPLNVPPPAKYSEAAGFNDGGDDVSDAEEGEYDKKKLAMQIGGGLGLAALVGGGIYAYTKHKSGKAEEAKRETWKESATEEAWLSGAEKRTQQVNDLDDKPPVYWVLTSGGNIPSNALEVGRESDGTPLFAARTFYQGGLHVGKAGRHFQPAGAVIGWGGLAQTVDRYEVLVGDESKVTWKRFDDVPKVRGFQPVDAGREQDGSFLFLGRAEYGGGVQVGKVQDDEASISFGYGDSEVKTSPFEIAAYA